MNDLTDEERQMAKKRTAKPEKKKKKALPFKASTKAGKRAEQVASARAKKPGKKPAKAPEPETPASERGLETDALNLGPIELPSAEDSLRVLKELAELNDRALKAHKRYEDLKADTKTAKDKWDDLAEQVQTRLRQATHKSDLPLFADMEQREADQRAMQSAGENASATEPGEPEENEPTADQAEDSPAPLAAPAAAGGLDEAMGAASDSSFL